MWFYFFSNLLDWIKSLLKVISNINNPLKINFYKFNNWNESFNSGWFSTAKLLIRFSRSGFSPFLQTLSQMLLGLGSKTGRSRMLHSELDTTLYTTQSPGFHFTRGKTKNIFIVQLLILNKNWIKNVMPVKWNITWNNKRGGETKYVFYLFWL